MQRWRRRRGRPLEKPAEGGREDGLGSSALSPKDWSPALPRALHWRPVRFEGPANQRASPRPQRLRLSRLSSPVCLSHPLHCVWLAPRQHSLFQCSPRTLSPAPLSAARRPSAHVAPARLALTAEMKPRKRRQYSPTATRRTPLAPTRESLLATIPLCPNTQFVYSHAVAPPNSNSSPRCPRRTRNHSVSVGCLL